MVYDRKPLTLSPVERLLLQLDLRQCQLVQDVQLHLFVALVTPISPFCRNVHWWCAPTHAPLLTLITNTRNMSSKSR